MKKKLLFIIWSFTAGGGAEKILANVVNNLDMDRYEISILEFSNFNIKNEYVKENINIINPIINVRVYESKLLTIINNIKNKLIYLMVRNYPKIIRWIYIKEDYDIEVAFNYGTPSFLVAHKQNGKKICWVHSSIEDLDYKNDKKIKKKYKRQKKAFSKMDNIVAISSRTQESIKYLYPEVKDKVFKIYNGYNFQEILDKSKENISSIDKNKIVLIAIGRLVQQKNFSLLIDAAYEIKKQKLDFVLYILGEGNQKGLLIEKIEKYKLNDYVKMVGYVDNPYPYIKNADLFCMTSESEGFPTVLIESMIIGCPFVSTNVAGADELAMNGECGIITQSNAKSISNEIINLVRDKERLKLMSQNAKIKASEYSLRVQNNKIEQILRDK